MINIVTINLNNKEGLQKTINSVINQTFFDKIKYIIIDGCSTDGSKELIEQYQDKLYYWVSEKDGGIYNAMNKAIEKLDLEGYSLFLNSGDYLSKDDTIETLYGSLNGLYGIVYGDELKVGNNKRYVAKYPDKLDEAFFKKTSLPHQSTFIRNDLLKKYKYSEDYKIISDWILLRQITLIDKMPYLHLNFVVSVYNLDGFSYKNVSLMYQEKSNYYRK